VSCAVTAEEHRSSSTPDTPAAAAATAATAAASRSTSAAATAAAQEPWGAGSSKRVRWSDHQPGSTVSPQPLVILSPGRGGSPSRLASTTTAGVHSVHHAEAVNLTLTARIEVALCEVVGVVLSAIVGASPLSPLPWVRLTQVSDDTVRSAVLGYCKVYRVLWCGRLL
jgi:hypothetical protein